MSSTDVNRNAIARKSKTRWPLEAKASVIRAKQDGKTAVEAFAAIAEEFALDLKPSYRTLAGAHSHLFRFRRELRSAKQSPSARNHTKVAALCAELGILKE